MGRRFVTLAILVVLAVGCGCPAAHDAQGKSNPGTTAKPEVKQPETAKSSVPTDKVDTKVESTPTPYPLKLSEHPLGPTLGLPLDIHIDSPEVPERLLGPTPMSALKEKPEKTEEEKEKKDEEK